MLKNIEKIFVFFVNTYFCGDNVTVGLGFIALVNLKAKRK